MAVTLTFEGDEGPYFVVDYNVRNSTSQIIRATEARAQRYGRERAS